MIFKEGKRGSFFFFKQTREFNALTHSLPINHFIH